MEVSDGSVLVRGDRFLEALGKWRTGKVDFTYLDVADILLHHEKVIFTTPRPKLERKFITGPWARASWRDSGREVYEELTKRGVIQVSDKSLVQ